MVAIGGYAMITTHPPNYYTVNNPADPIAMALGAIRKAEHQLISQIMPDEDTDFELAVSTLAISTGYSRHRVRQLILAFYQLRDLPLLEQLQQDLFHLDHQRLITISNALFGLNPEHLGVVDELLTDYLTPTAPNQALPSHRSIRAKIAAIRTMLDDAKADPDKDPTNRKEFDISPGDNDTTAHLFASVDPVEGKLINEAVAKHAEATGRNKGEAFVDLILSKVKVKVALNLYSAKDLANAPVWGTGIGWLDEKTGNHWSARATTVRDMDQAMRKHAAGHDPTPDIRAAVEGRDGGCVAPYCTVSADRCDLDHRINYEDGGCTCIGNLSSACRHHHNGKTDGRCVYLADPVTGIVVWVWEDGTWAVNVPEGPLTPQSARWAQTVSQYRTKHRKRWAAAAKAQTETQATEAQEDAPPF